MSRFGSGAGVWGLRRGGVQVEVRDDQRMQTDALLAANYPQGDAG
jgi:hypothetical protein